MAIVHSASLSVSVIADVIDTALSTAKDELRASHAFDLVDGAGDSQFDVLYHEAHTLAASGTKDYDLAGGGLVDRLGAAVLIAELAGIFIKNLETTNGIDLQVGAGSNPVTSLWLASGDAINVRASGSLCLLANLEGYAVTASTADVLRTTNLSGSSTLDYEIYLLGRSS